MTLLGPLTFTPIYKEKVWGGRSLAWLGRDLPGTINTPIGESWDLVDLSTTAVSGGGGSSERSVVHAGPHAGRTLNELIKSQKRDLLGDLRPTPSGEFPLLVKFLDASENLSVQVHPNAQYVKSHADAFLKSEAWYVVDAKPGAVIYKGIRPGVTPAAFKAALESNDPGAVESMLIKVPVQAGDCHYLPSGTCHALGAGILVAEVQTPSDTTFRVFDWGRSGRELHIEQAMQCIHFGPAEVGSHERRSVIENDQTMVTRLVNCEYFRIDRVVARAGVRLPLQPGQPRVWIVLSGKGRIHGPGQEQLRLEPGLTVLLPASLAEACWTVPAAMTFLEVSFPQTDRKSLA